MSCIHGPGDIYKCGHPDCVGARMGCNGKCDPSFGLYGKYDPDCLHHSRQLPKHLLKQVIYIVTAGNFSDYEICEVFASKESADKYVEHYNGKYAKRPELKDWWRVEEWKMKL